MRAPTFIDTNSMDEPVKRRAGGYPLDESDTIGLYFNRIAEGGRHAEPPYMYLSVSAPASDFSRFLLLGSRALIRCSVPMGPEMVPNDDNPGDVDQDESRVNLGSQNDVVEGEPCNVSRMDDVAQLQAVHQSAAHKRDRFHEPRAEHLLPP